MFTLHNKTWDPFCATYSHPRSLAGTEVTHVKTIMLASAAKQQAVSSGLQLFKGKDSLKKAQIGELYEALIVTADSDRTVRLFALSAQSSKIREQGSFLDLICQVKLSPSILIKAVDYYTNFNTIVVTTDNDTIKITHSLKPCKQTDLGVHLPPKLLSQVTLSLVFEIGQTEYRACGLASGEVSLLDGDDLQEWGESLVKTFQPMTSLRTSKSLLTDATTSQVVVEEQGRRLTRAMSFKKTMMVP